MKRIKFLAIALTILAGSIAGPAIASADDNSGAFLCPVVGDGVVNADAHNGDNGVSIITPPVGTSFLPGNNQAGAKANHNAHNTIRTTRMPVPVATPTSHQSGLARLDT
ncbi:MAG: hypothetical protein IIC28_08200 [Chloroflexi bacterium]|nr:hypothetical protein [Chloroflexota bacterium]